MGRGSRAVGVFAACGVVLLAACGDDGGGSASGTTADPRGIFAPTNPVEVGYRTCDVLPVEAVNAALGLSLVGTSVPVSGDPRACQYGNYDDAGAVVVTIVVAPTAAEANQRYERVAAETSGSPIAGVGERAVIAPFSDRLVGQQGLVVADVYVTGEALLETEAAELAAAVNAALAAGSTVTPPAP